MGKKAQKKERKTKMSGKYVFSKALRFHHCQTSDHSNAIRSFLTRAYPTMKHHNPHTPILIREAMNIQPRVFARYEFGKEKMADLQGLDDKAIEDKVSGLVQASQ